MSRRLIGLAPPFSCLLVIPTCAEVKSSQSQSQDGLMDSGELEATAGDVPLIGIFLHGGGYCHMSAHEKASTSKIPARLMKVGSRKYCESAYTQVHIGQGIHGDTRRRVSTPPTCTIPRRSARCRSGLRAYSPPPSTTCIKTHCKLACRQAGGRRGIQRTRRI